jgi:two-component system, NarL family, sensor histidine kinase UhpB
MKRRDSLIGQVVAVNVLLVLSTLFAAAAAAGLDLNFEDHRFRFALLAMAIILVLCVNMLMLRRRFSPLEELIERIESADPANPGGFRPLGEPQSSDEVERLTAAFRRLLDRIVAEQRRSGRLALRAQEEERKRLARDLHDEVNQALTAILLRLEALSQDAPHGLAEEINELKRLVNQAMDELLQLARQLRPSALDDHGLVPAIEGQVRRFGEQTGIKIGLRTTGVPGEQLEPDHEIVVYRVAQEALSNVAQHAEAEHVDVDLDTNGSGVRLRVRDDGRGFVPGGPSDGLGLNGMSERARLIGGNVRIDSSPGLGTTVKLEIP